MFIIFIIILIFLFLFSIEYERKSKKFKRDVVVKVLNEKFQDVRYGFDRGFEKGTIFNTELVKRGNIFKSDDYIKATFNGIPFEFADVMIQNRVQTGKSTSTITYFQGQWLIVKPPKQIMSELYVIDRNFYYSNPNTLFSKRFDKVELESTEFNKEFNVYANDSHEAFYMLNPQLIMSLLKIHEENVSFYMNRDALHIAIYSRKNFFEPKFFGSNAYEVDRAEILASISNALKYLDLFDLDKVDV